MNIETFSQRILEAMPLPPQARHTAFSAVHDEVLAEYSAAVRALTAAQAAVPTPIVGDERTVLQIVGHIMAWERFAILSAGEILAGVQRPRFLFRLEGYIEEDGTATAVASIDGFNAHVAAQQADLPWPTIQQKALHTAHALHTLFTQPGLLTADLLEQTAATRHRLPNGERIASVAAGWALWMIVLEHAGAEHAAEIGMAA